MHKFFRLFIYFYFLFLFIFKYIRIDTLFYECNKDTFYFLTWKLCVELVDHHNVSENWTHLTENNTSNELFKIELQMQIFKMG